MEFFIWLPDENKDNSEGDCRAVLYLVLCGENKNRKIILFSVVVLLNLVNRFKLSWSDLLSWDVLTMEP